MPRLLERAKPLKRISVVLMAALIAVGPGGTLRVKADDNGDFDRLKDKTKPCRNDSPVAPPFTAAMPIPPTAHGDNSPDTAPNNYTISEERSQAEIIPGIVTPIWGYRSATNGTAAATTPGPTILARKHTPVNVTFVNNLPPDEDRTGIIFQSPPNEERPFLPSSTTVHLHGINGDHFSDGYPTDNDSPGHIHRRLPATQNPGRSTLTHHYPNDDYQRPATLWYHDHSVNITSEHIYRGLSAFYWLYDDQETDTDDALRLPGSIAADGPKGGYGVFDIPLVQQDKMIDRRTGKLIYNNCSTFGTLGDVMTVNGKQQPFFKVFARKYRFRHLDGSDTRQYLIAIRTLANARRPVDDDRANEPFFLIGSDQGLLFNTVTTDRFHTAPAMRWEFVFDFTKYAGQRLVMVNLLVEPDKPKLFFLMAFDVGAPAPDASDVPPVLRPELTTTDQAENAANAAPASQRRRFEFDKSEFWVINDRTFNEHRDDARPLINTNEDWTLVNGGGGWGHPIHIHLGRFKVLKIDGRAPVPGELEGFKDVVWLGPDQTIRVRHQFWNFTDRFVFHCHNGTHEDNAMMSQFNVQPGPPGTVGGNGGT